MTAPALYVPFEKLTSASDDTWASLVAPLVAEVESFLPAGSTVSADPRRRLLVASWAGGPSMYEVSGLVSDVLGKSSSFHEDVWFGWPGLDASFTRSVPSAARGFALLTAALSGACPRCASAPEAFAYAFAEALERSDSHLLSAHPYLASLELFGVPLERLTRTAEVVGALFADEPHASAEVFFHARGHLAGLLALVDSLTA